MDSLAPRRSRLLSPSCAWKILWTGEPCPQHATSRCSANYPLTAGATALACSQGPLTRVTHRPRLSATMFSRSDVARPEPVPGLHGPAPRNFLAEEGNVTVQIKPWLAWIVMAVLGWYVSSFVKKLAEHHAKLLICWFRGEKIKTALAKSIPQLAGIVTIFLVIVAANMFFPPYARMSPEQSVQNLVNQLTLTEKALLCIGFQARHGKLPVPISRVQEHLDELGKLPDPTSSALYVAAHQSLVAKGLIEDHPFERKEGGKFSFTIGLTPEGERIFRKLIEMKLLK